MKKIITTIVFVLLSVCVFADPLVTSGGTIEASVGGGSSSSGGSGGGGGGYHPPTNTTTNTPSCEGLIYGYPQGLHTCRVYNNCSVPIGLQRVDKCPYDQELNYSDVCVGSSCEAQVIEMPVEVVKEVPVYVYVNDTNSTAVVSEESKSGWMWVVLLGLAILLFISAIIVGLKSGKSFNRIMDMEAEFGKINGKKITKTDANLSNVNVELTKQKSRIFDD